MNNRFTEVETALFEYFTEVEILNDFLRHQKVPEGFPYDLKIVKQTVETVSSTRKEMIVVIKASSILESDDIFVDTYPVFFTTNTVIQKYPQGWGEWETEIDFIQVYPKLVQFLHEGDFAYKFVYESSEEEGVHPDNTTILLKELASIGDRTSLDKLTKKLCKCPETKAGFVDNIVGVALEQIGSDPQPEQVEEKPKKRGRGRPKKTESN